MPRSNDSIPVFAKASNKGIGTNAGVSVDVAAASLPVVGNGDDPVWSPSIIYASGDAAALVTIESPAGTVLWRQRFSAAFAIEEDFDPGDYPGASASLMRLKISASTTNCEAEITAVAIRNPSGTTPSIRHI